MRRLFIFILGCWMTGTSFAQTDITYNDSICHWERKKIDDKYVLWPQLIIREAFEDITEKQKPAKLALTLPEGEKRQYMINSGLSISLNHICNKSNEKMSRKSPSAFLVYNRNTIIKKLQNQLKVGAGYEYQWGTTHIGAGGNDYDYNHYGYWNNTLQYVNNKKDTAKSILLTSMISPFRNNTSGRGVFWNSKKQIAGPFFYILSPSVGLEVQHTFRAKKQESVGAIVRPNLNSSASLVFMKQQRDANGALTPAYSRPSLFEFRAGYTARYELINTSDIKDQFIPLLKADFIYYPFATDNVSLTFTYQDGADPVAALEDQKFWTLTITIKK